MLKMVILHHGAQRMMAILDDRSERTIILPAAVQFLELGKQLEDLSLRTVRQEQGASVSFEISSFFQGGQSQPVRGLPIPHLDKVQPLVLIRSDHPHLVIPTEPVHSGPRDGPVAVYTALGWAIQGPASFLAPSSPLQQCLFTSALSPSAELLRNVQKLWEVDAFPHRKEMEVT